MMNLKLIILLLVAFLLSSCKIGRLVWFNLPDQKDFKYFPAKEIKSNPTEFFKDAPVSKISEIKVKTKNMKGDSLPLDIFLEKQPIIAFIISRNDSILFERYFDGYNKNDVLTSFSLAKVYMSALIGIAVDEHKIKSIDSPITEYLPELKKNKKLETITIKHLLEHRSGIKYKEVPFNPLGKMSTLYYSRNMEKKILPRLKSKMPPGLKYEYQSINTFLLGIILERATGKSPAEYLSEKIWIPLGMESNASWMLDRKNGKEKTFCCINAQARDHARFGTLYINKGQWNNQQIVSEKWIEQSIPCQPNDTTFVFPFHWQSGYCNRKDFNARGLYEQYIFVDPKTNLVIVQLCKKNYFIKFSWRDFYRELCDKINAL
ncbi:MAG: serine hydrolase domain-containing protein [Bacteroidia bacterium]